MLAGHFRKAGLGIIIAGLLSGCAYQMPGAYSYAPVPCAPAAQPAGSPPANNCVAAVPDYGAYPAVGVAGYAADPYLADPYWDDWGPAYGLGFGAFYGGYAGYYGGSHGYHGYGGGFRGARAAGGFHGGYHGGGGHGGGHR